MPTLDEMRRWAAGEDVPGLPKRAAAETTPSPPNQTTPTRAPIVSRHYDVVITDDLSESIEATEIAKEISDLSVRDERERKLSELRERFSRLEVRPESVSDSPSEYAYSARREIIDGIFGKHDPSWVEKLAAEVTKPKLSEAEAKAETYSKCKFAVSSTGEDAVLHFGKYKDMKVSEVIRDDPSYIDWIIRERGFKIELKDVCKHVREQFVKVKVFDP